MASNCLLAVPRYSTFFEKQNLATPKQSGSGGSLISMRNGWMLMETVNSETYVVACVLGPQEESNGSQKVPGDGSCDVAVLRKCRGQKQHLTVFMTRKQTRKMAIFTNQTK